MEALSWKHLSGDILIILSFTNSSNTKVINIFSWDLVVSASWKKQLSIMFMSSAYRRQLTLANIIFFIRTLEQVRGEMIVFFES